MKVKTLLTGTTLALAGWFALASASTLKSPALPGYQVAQNEQHERNQGQRGHDGKNPGDEWYQGQQGHWSQEKNGWQFQSQGLVCNSQGRNCRQGGYIPPNGQGMVNRQNSNLYWACDSDGHNCHWAQRSR
jgi:hypothetical protein